VKHCHVDGVEVLAMNEDEMIGAAILFGGIAYVVAIFGYFIIWPLIHPLS
jgi:hypothetical protein